MLGRGLRAAFGLRRLSSRGAVERAIGSVAPGLAATAVVSSCAVAVSSILPPSWHLSAVPLSIVLGAAAANTPFLRTHAELLNIKPGVSFATTRLLRTGVVCVGSKLSALQVLALGWATVPAAVASVSVGLVAIPMLARLMGVAPRLGSLLAAGTSICGVTAISAVAPAIGASQAEVAIAVANVVAFGLLAATFVPVIAPMLLPASDSDAIGLFLGLAVHDTAQVMGAGQSYVQMFGDEAVLAAACVTKLARNVLLCVAVPFISSRHSSVSGAGSIVSLQTVAKAFPPFVGLFLLAAVARSVGDWQLATNKEAYGPRAEAAWKKALSATSWLGSSLLGLAMAGVGLSVNASAFAGVGLQPFVVGGAGAFLVGSTGLTAALLVSRARAASTERAAA